MKIFSIISIISIIFPFFSLCVQARTIEFDGKLPSCPAKYLTGALLASDGSIWVISEGEGVYRLYPERDYSKRNQDSWMEVSYYSGLEHHVNCYAIAEDKQGRIWIGTDNQGVFVFNGEKWNCYNRDNALPGERIFDLSVSPITGEVAIATSGGVTIYCPADESWHTLSRADGLQEDQVASLVYDRKGNLWIAYQCSGVSVISGREPRKLLYSGQAPWSWDKNNRSRQPFEAKGKGLPSNLCNDISVLQNGMVLLGTHSGLAFWKQRTGKPEWYYIRGKNYIEKNKGLWDIVVPHSPSTVSSEKLLPEDFITCIAESREGVWVGFRKQGACLLNSSTLTKIKESHFPGKNAFPCIKSFLVLPGGYVYAATYGEGLVEIHQGNSRNTLSLPKQRHSISNPIPPPLPQNSAWDNEWAKRDRLLSEGGTSPIVFWKEDWATQGDWCQRYGAHMALLCGTDQPRNDKIGASTVPWILEDDTLEFKELPYIRENRCLIGPHHVSDGGIWNQFFQGNVLENRNVIYNPHTGTRTAAQSMDRNGENYPEGFDGPDMWTVIDVPEGSYELALYFYHYDKQDGGRDSCLDYVIEVRKDDIPEKPTQPGEPTQFSGEEIKQIISAPVLARTRAYDFNGCGVYKSFYVCEPGRYYVRILNNYSTKTILNGIFTSLLEKGTGFPVDVRFYHDQLAYGEKPLKPVDPKRNELEKNAELLKDWQRASFWAVKDSPAINQAHYVSGGFLSQNRLMQYGIYRKLEKQDASYLNSYWRWFLRFWDQQDHHQFELAMEKIWHHVQDMYVICRSEVFLPYSPRVVPFDPNELEIMQYMGIDWKDYLPESQEKPPLQVMELKEKISSMSEADVKNLQTIYLKKKYPDVQFENE